jgi:hypothetical protein
MLRALSWLFLFVLTTWRATAAPAPANVNGGHLELVAGFPGRQITGIAVSKQNRIFVNLPFWSDPHTISVAEVQGNNLVPYPDATWNQNEGDPAKRFVCV